MSNIKGNDSQLFVIPKTLVEYSVPINVENEIFSEIYVLNLENQIPKLYRNQHSFWIQSEHEYLRFYIFPTII